jgi:hypothetical protein
VGIEELVPGARIEELARLSAVLVLVASAGDQLEEPQPLGRTDLLDRLMAINGFEGRAFTDLLWACHTTGKSRSPAEWWQAERAILEKALASVPGFQLAVPRQADRRAVLEHTGRVLERVYERSLA